MIVTRKPLQLPMADLKPVTEISFAEIFLCSAFAACFAEFCTLPLDTAKVRLQLQKKAAAAVVDGVGFPKYRGLLVLWPPLPGKKVCRHFGKALFQDYNASVFMEAYGLAYMVKRYLVGSEFIQEIPLYHKILAAFLTGAIAIIVANPTDLVKVRLQAEGKLPAGVPRRYSGAWDAYFTIVKQEGLGALWTGLGPNVARNAIVNAAELASYDQVKQMILNIPGFMDNILTHLLAGLGAGFFAVCIGSPVEVVKSRMMGDSTYKNTVDCFIKTLKSEGFFAFYKGFFPNFGRLGSWNAIMFLTFEQAKRIF
ncbi:mitochondrial uncoupling protein 2 [Quercus suber]|uniref:Mitochondrial uncoupling protein 2 n=1 Tax=Quercus suber TaxID=58331 RepID=A0AAW0IRX8_QUESU